jgi:hypothetical protein
MIAPISSLSLELSLLMFKVARKKTAISILAALCLFLFGAKAAFASSESVGRHITYQTRLGHDLDGDRIPESATIRHCGYVYQVNIHFSTGRPKLRLTTYVTEGVAGLSFQTTDVNHDSQSDLVIISATSLRPLAVWLNQGKSKFQKISSWSSGIGDYTGPGYHRPATSRPEPTGGVSIDPLPQLASAVDYFDIRTHFVAVLSSECDRLPVDSIFQQIPARGPPRTPRV